MTEQREKRNDEIRTEFDKLRNLGLPVIDCLDRISQMSYGITSETVRKIVYSTTYCRREKQAGAMSKN